MDIVVIDYSIVTLSLAFPLRSSDIKVVSPSKAERQNLLAVAGNNPGAESCPPHVGIQPGSAPTGISSAKECRQDEGLVEKAPGLFTIGCTVTKFRQSRMTQATAWFSPPCAAVHPGGIGDIKGRGRPVSYKMRMVRDKGGLGRSSAGLYDGTRPAGKVLPLFPIAVDFLDREIIINVKQEGVATRVKSPARRCSPGFTVGASRLARLLGWRSYEPGPEPRFFLPK